MKKTNFFILIPIFICISLLGCSTPQKNTEQTSDTEAVSVSEYDTDKISEIAKTAPMFLQIGYQDLSRLVLYGSYFFAVYEFDAKAETWNLKDAVDLSVFDMALLENDCVSTICFRANDLLFSPRHTDTDTKDEPVYQYDYATGEFSKLTKLNGADIEGLVGQSAFTNLSYEFADTASQISSQLEAQSARLFGQLGALQPAPNAGQTPLLNMAYGFFALDAENNLVYGMSDSTGSDIRLFPLF